MDQSTSFKNFSRWLDMLYDHAIQGIPGMDSAQKLADNYRKAFPTKNDAVANLIRWESVKAATSGFITGLGGITVLPVTLPASLTGLLFIQIRMIAAIAIIGGYSVYDIRTRNFIYICLGTSAVKETLRLGGGHLLSRLSNKDVQEISKLVTTKLVGQLATGRLLGTAPRYTPLLGGFVSGGLDWLTVRTTGEFARRVFLPK
ncbi:EcsC family protein [Brenneria roseae subsp. americana]|uniref:EcsC family protein n=1 Tax=Brenneria roseae subsp. americana TaxID=1508507 RepID=A0A2U1TY92_9GAMM|nr:EcsC family protein [Brenneria roseae]PWC14322.1 EcsC family protein [Brenneria roseae subsp. americana]